MDILIFSIALRGGFYLPLLTTNEQTLYRGEIRQARFVFFIRVAFSGYFPPLFFFFFVFFFQFFKLDCNNLSKCQLLCWQPAECELRLKSGRLLGFGQREVLCVHVMADYCYLIQYERKD